MNPDFDKLDAEMMKKLSPLRGRPLKKRLTDGFAASVERRIRLAGEPPAKPSAARWAAPALVPVLALSVLLLVGHPAKKPVQLAQLDSSAETLSAEIQALRELGEWTDADDGGPEVTAEDLVELSQGPSRSALA